MYNNEPSLSNHIPEGIGHESLKGGGRIGHAEEHDGGLIKSSVSDEGGFPLVAFLYSDIVISPSYIKLGKDLGIFEFVDEIRDQGEGICISNCMAIEILVILAGSKASILFLDEEERRSLGGFGWTNFPRAKVFVDELICSLPFFDREGVEFSYFWDEGFVQVYGMVVGSGWGYMISGFLGENLSVFGILSREGFLGFHRFCLHG